MESPITNLPELVQIDVKRLSSQIFSTSSRQEHMGVRCDWASTALCCCASPLSSTHRPSRCSSIATCVATTQSYVVSSNFACNATFWWSTKCSCESGGEFNVSFSPSSYFNCWSVEYHFCHLFLVTLLIPSLSLSVRDSCFYIKITANALCDLLHFPCLRLFDRRPWLLPQVFFW